MKKTMIGICLMMLILSFQCVFGSSDTCGTNVTFTIDGNTISFSKTDPNAAAEFDSSCRDIFKDRSEITVVRVNGNENQKIHVSVGNSLFKDSCYVQEMDLSNLDVSDVTDMKFMFSECWELTSLDLSGWDTSGVTYMGAMFFNCESLTGLDMSGWDTSGVMTMDGMFLNCYSLTSLDLSGWDTSNVTNSSGMFLGCNSLNEFVLGANTLEQNIFESHPKYYLYWTAVDGMGNPSFITGSTIRGANLFGYYREENLGKWQYVQPKAVSVYIKDAVGNDITGDTIISDTINYQLSASAKPDDAVQEVIWTSSDESIATVDTSGKVTFTKAGTVTITATVNDEGGASDWVNLQLLPEATAITITDSKGTDITGKTVTSNDTTYQLKAKAAPADAAQTVTWNSSDTAVATVDSSGKVTFAKAGTVTITATSTDRGKVTATVKLKLLPEATAITITNSAGTVITGKTITSDTVNYQLKASASPADAAQTVTWKSSDTAVAAVSTAGKVTFKGPGTVTITATSTDRGKVTATVKLKLLPEATSIVIKNKAGTVITGKTITSDTLKYQLYASAKPADAAQTVTWKSSDTAVATVSAKGLVTFKKAGTVTITATSTDRGKVTATVKLKLLPEATRIIIKNSKGTAITGKTVTVKTKTFQLKAAAKPRNAAQTVTWKSSNKKIATVSRAGKVTFKKAGTVTITATSTDRGKKSAAVKLKYAP